MWCQSAILATGTAQRSDAQRMVLTKYFRSIVPELAEVRAQLKELETQLDGIRKTAGFTLRTGLSLVVCTRR